MTEENNMVRSGPDRLVAQERHTSAEPSGAEKFFQPRTPAERTVPTTCIETIGGDPATALRLSFQIKVF